MKYWSLPWATNTVSCFTWDEKAGTWPSHKIVSWPFNVSFRNWTVTNVSKVCFWDFTSQSHVQLKQVFYKIRREISNIDLKKKKKRLSEPKVLFLESTKVIHGSLNSWKIISFKFSLTDTYKIIHKPEQILPRISFKKKIPGVENREGKINYGIRL